MGEEEGEGGGGNMQRIYLPLSSSPSLDMYTLITWLILLCRITKEILNMRSQVPLKGHKTMATLHLHLKATN